jgi:hypothetical protein
MGHPLASELIAGFLMLQVLDQSAGNQKQRWKEYMNLFHRMTYLGALKDLSDNLLPGSCAGPECRKAWYVFC